MSEQYLRIVTAVMQRKHLDEAIQERNAACRCGNPTCPNAVISEQELLQRGRYKLDLHNLRIHDRMHSGANNRFCGDACRQWTETFMQERMRDELPYIRTDAAYKLMQMMFPQEMIKSEDLKELKRQVDLLFERSARDPENQTPATLKVVERGFDSRDRHMFVESVKQQEQRAAATKLQMSQEVEGYLAPSAYVAHEKQQSKNAETAEKDEMRKSGSGLPSSKTGLSAEGVIKGTKGKIKRVSFESDLLSQKSTVDALVGDELESNGEPSESDEMPQKAREMLEFNKLFMNKFLFNPFPQDWQLNEPDNPGDVQNDVEYSSSGDDILFPDKDEEPAEKGTMSKFGFYWTVLSDWVSEHTVQLFNRKMHHNRWNHGEESTSQEDPTNAKDLRALRIFRDIYETEHQTDIFATGRDTNNATSGRPRLPKRVTRRVQQQGPTPNAANGTSAEMLNDLLHVCTPSPERGTHGHVTEDAIVEFVGTSSTAHQPEHRNMEPPLPTTETELQRLRLVERNLSRMMSLVCRDIHFSNVSYMDTLVADLVRTFNYSTVLPAFSQSDWKVIAYIILQAFSTSYPSVADGIKEHAIMQKLSKLGINDNQVRLLVDLILNGV